MNRVLVILLLIGTLLIIASRAQRDGLFRGPKRMGADKVNSSYLFGNIIEIGGII